MRNLKEHPVTKSEMVELLEGMAEHFQSEQLVGDMRPTLLEQAALHVAYSQALVNELGLIIE